MQITWEKYAQIKLGVTKFDGQTNWTYYDYPIATNSMAFDNRGYIWFGTSRGLTRFNGINHWSERTFPVHNNYTANDIKCITLDSTGNIWAGVDKLAVRGLGKYDGVSQWDFYDTSNSTLPHNMISGVATDVEGNVWVGTEGGLVKIDRQSNWEVYNISNSDIPSNKVGCITIDQSGNVWLACGGLTKFDGTTWTNYNESNSGLPHNDITDIVVDRNGNKWIGMYALWPARGGLAVFKEGGVITGVKGDTENSFVTKSFRLFPNYPNPFNPTTTLRYTLPKQTEVLIAVYNIAGQEIEIIVNKTQPAGEYEVQWNAGHLPSGVYIAKLQVGDFTATRKLVLLK